MMRTVLTVFVAVMTIAVTISAQAADTSSDSAASAAALEPIEPLDIEPKSKLKIGPILVGSMGAVMTVVGAGFAWQTKQEYEDYQKLPTDELADDVEKHQIVANVLMFTGGAVVIGSVLWWILSGDDETDETTTSAEVAKNRSPVKLKPVLAPGHAGVVMTF